MSDTEVSIFVKGCVTMAADLRSPRPLAEAEYEVDSTPVALSDLFSPQVLGRAKSALITAVDEPIYYRLGGSWNDELDYGHVLPAGGPPISLQTRGLVVGFRALAVDSAAAIHVTLFT